MCNFFVSFQSQLGSCEFTCSFQLFNGLLRTFSDLLLSTAISKAGNFRDPLNFREPGHEEILHSFSSYGNYSTIQSTSDNSNEKSWSYWEFEANKQNDGEGMQVSCTFHGDGH